MGKVFDCFTFFNEVELLKFRIEYLKEEVDYFVIIEASQTHSGKKKTQNFSYDMFSEDVLHKIKYFYIDFPEDNLLDYLDVNAEYMLQTKEGLLSWARENYQRNFIANCLTDADENDIILISDLDEVININLIKFLKEKPNFLEEYKLVSLGQIPFYYSIYNPFYIGKEDKCELWLHPKATLRKFMVESPNVLRLIGGSAAIRPGGWHFGYMGNNNRIKIKKESVATHNNESEDIEDKISERLSEKQYVLENNEKLSIDEIKEKFGVPDLVFSEEFIDFFTGGE